MSDNQSDNSQTENSQNQGVPESTKEINNYSVSENTDNNTFDMSSTDGKVSGIPQTQAEIEARKSEENRPEWLLPKYKTEIDQAKAYPEAQKKIGELSNRIQELEKSKGAQTGAPEEYDLPEIEGWQWDTESAELKNAIEVFSKLNINQAAATELLQTYVNEKIGDHYSAEDEKKRLGIDADKQITDLTQWATNTLSKESAGLIHALLEYPTVENVKLLNELRNLNQQTVPPVNNYIPSSKPQTAQELAKHIAENLYSGEKIANNPDLHIKYLKEMQKLTDQAKG